MAHGWFDHTELVKNKLMTNQGEIWKQINTAHEEKFTKVE